MIDINTLPRLEKTIQFDDRFNADWRFSQVRKVFLAMGYPPFFEFLCDWIGLIVNQYCGVYCADNEPSNDKAFKKILLLNPRHNDNAIGHCPGALSLIKGLNQYWQVNSNDFSELKRRVSGELLLLLNDSDITPIALDTEDMMIVKQVFQDLADFFFMLQWVEISQFAPEYLPKPQIIYRGGKPTYQWDFL